MGRAERRFGRAPVRYAVGGAAAASIEWLRRTRTAVKVTLLSPFRTEPGIHDVDAEARGDRDLVEGQTQHMSAVPDSITDVAHGTPETER